MVYLIHYLLTSPSQDKRLEREADKSPANSAKVINE